MLHPIYGTEGFSVHKEGLNVVLLLVYFFPDVAAPPESAAAWDTQSIKTKMNNFGKGIDVTGFVCGLYGRCRSTLLRYERATCFLCTFLHSILAWQSCLRPCQKDTVSNRRRRTAPSLRTALEWIQKIGNNSRDVVIPVSGRGIMMALFDGKKAGRAVRRVSCEIDVMSVAHTNLSSFQKKPLMSFCKKLVILLMACFGFVLI